MVCSGRQRTSAMSLHVWERRRLAGATNPGDLSAWDEIQSGLVGVFALEQRKMRGGLEIPPLTARNYLGPQTGRRSL